MNVRCPSLRSPLLRLAAGVGALALGVVPLTACGAGPGADDGRVDVVASFYPTQFLAEEIGGRHVSVNTLTEPGVEPHDLEITPQQVGELSEADLVVYLKGLQPAVDEAVEQSEAEHVAEVGSFASLDKPSPEHRGETGETGESSETGEHNEPGAHGGHDEPGGHEGHDHGTDGGHDPHFWLDPVRWAEAAEGVGQQLAEADPKHGAAYEKNTARLVERLEALDEDYREGLAGRKTDTFLTTHAAFGHLAERYGLHEESVSGVDPESGSVSAAHVRELHAVAKEDGVTTVFAEGDGDDTARTLARDLDLKTGVLNPLEAVKDPGTQDYFSVMRQNLSALRTALGAQ